MATSSSTKLREVERVGVQQRVLILLANSCVDINDHHLVSKRFLPNLLVGWDFEADALVGDKNGILKRVAFWLP